MSGARIEDAPFQPDLIALAAVGAAAPGVTSLYAILTPRRALEFGETVIWPLFTLLTLHGLVVGVVPARALVVPSTPALVERLGGKRLLACAVAS